MFAGSCLCWLLLVSAFPLVICTGSAYWYVCCVGVVRSLSLPFVADKYIGSVSVYEYFAVCL